MPQPAVEEMVAFERKIAGGGTVGFDEEAETQALEVARSEVASLLHANPNEVAILSSATEGICTVAWSLDFKKAGNIVSTDADFPSVVYPWMRLARSKGCEVRLARNRNGIVDEREIERLVDDHTLAISISHVEYGTGQRFDIRWLSDLAHRHGAILVVDATQSAGLMPLDVHKDDVDALVAGGYKGLLGPFGSACLYIRADLIPKLDPPLVGWRSARVPYALDATQMPLAEASKKFEFSTMSYASATGLGASLTYLRKHDYSNITGHVISLIQNFMETVAARHPTTTVLTPRAKSSQASIASFRFANHDQSEIAARLVNRGVIVSQRFNGVRFSFHMYNSERDLTSAMERLDEILAE
jgi:selenocysteine lyase/cysteine desulfurase